jgi:hypothetical protein
MPRRMGIVLGVADFLVLLAIVISVSHAVWRGQSQGLGPLLLSICIILATSIFALVSFIAAYGLAESSSLGRAALLIFLILTAIVARAAWANKTVA